MDHAQQRRLVLTDEWLFIRVSKRVDHQRLLTTTGWLGDWRCHLQALEQRRVVHGATREVLYLAGGSKRDCMGSER
jgi:hypothetical protein